MLYELIAVVRAGKPAETKEIARAASLLVLSSHGVVRGITNWGTFLLTKPRRKNQARHTEGHHFVMRFDASAATQKAVKSMLGLDPRMVHFGIVKLGDGTLESIADVKGRAQWRRGGEETTTSR